MVTLIHRESWQNVLSIFESKAEVASFCLELSKKLGMRYESPPLPVDLSILNHRDKGTTSCTHLLDNIDPNEYVDSSVDHNDVSINCSDVTNIDSSKLLRDLMAMYDSNTTIIYPTPDV